MPYAIWVAADISGWRWRKRGGHSLGSGVQWCVHLHVCAVCLFILWMSCVYVCVVYTSSCIHMLCLTSVCLQYVLCVCVCLLHAIYGQALMPRHLVLRGSGLPGGFWVLSAQYKPRQVVQASREGFDLGVTPWKIHLRALADVLGQ